MTETEFQGIKIEEEEPIVEIITFENEIKNVAFEEEQHWSEEEANCDGNFRCSFCKEPDKVKDLRKNVQDSNSVTELEESKFDASDFQKIKFVKEETIFETFTFENEIKEEIDIEEEDSLPHGKINCDGNFPSLFREEKFPLRKDAVFVGISSSESHDAAKKEIEHKNDNQTGGESSVNNEIYFCSEKCASDEDENIQASCSEYDYVSNDRRASHAHLKSFPCNTVGYHVASIYGNEKSFKCTECDYTSSRKYDLARHINSVHRKIKPYRCLVCDRKFCEMGNLTKHIRSVHKKEKPFKCSECDRAFRRKGNLTFHIRSVHKKEKPFKCAECDYSCCHKHDLTRHIRSVHRKEKPFKCTECNYSCCRKPMLTNHVSSLHKKEKPFNCAECDYTFSRKENLRKHIRSVHGEGKIIKALLL